MSSFQKQFILDVQARMKAKVSVIKFIDQNLGQWGESNFAASVGLAGMLIDFPDTDYSQIQGNDQLGSVNIKISLFFTTHSQSYNLAPEGTRAKALDYYDIEQKVVAALQGWHCDYFTPLNRTKAISRNQNELNLRIRELTFTSEFEECFEPETETETALVFNGQIQQTVPTD